MVNFSYKFRIYPNKTQQIILNKMFGCSRFVWNHFLSLEKKNYQETKKFKFYHNNSKTLTEIKKQKETQFLKEVNSQSLQAALKNLDQAFKSAFKKIHGFPVFKKKFNKQSFKVSQNLEIDQENNKVYIPKFKQGIDVVIHRKMKGRIISGTISKSKTGKFFNFIVL